MEKVKIKFLNEFRELFNKKWRVIIFYGGRYSGKSYHDALALLLRGRQEKLRVLCTREIQKTIKDSVHKLLKDLIYKYSMGDYVVTEEKIMNTITGTEVIFKGLHRNIIEIKSMEGIDICWIEEGQSVTKESLDILTPTIRKQGSQIWITFNRYAELDPVYEMFVLNHSPGTFVKKVNYDVLERVGLLSDVIKKEIEYDKANNPDSYAYKWLGEPLSQSDNAILSRSSVLQAMEREINDEGQIQVGVDVARMGDDRTVFYKRKGLKCIDKQIYSKIRLTESFNNLINFVSYNKNDIIKVDDTGVGGGLTDMLISNGYNVMPINFGGEPVDKDKYTNTISEGWFYLQSIMKEIQLPYDTDLLMELSTRQWKMDIKGRRMVEKKEDYRKRGFRSPDLADALILCYLNKKEFNIENDFAIV